MTGPLHPPGGALVSYFTLGVLTIAALACASTSPGNADETFGASTSSSGPSTSSGDPASSTGQATSASSSEGTAVDGSSGGSSSSGGEVELRGACPLAERVGGFQVAMESSYSAFSGSVADGVVPVSVLEQVGEDGPCILLRRNNPFCDPPCAPGQTCDFDGACIPYPTNHDVGVVAVTGLLQEVSIDPQPPAYSYFDTTLPNPAFDPGAAIRLTAGGGDYASFELHGIGVAMVDPTADLLSLSTDEPLTVEWASTASDATLRVVLSVDQHGLSPLALICESPDTGSLEISAAIMSEFLDAGVSGYPSADYFLQTVDSVELEPGCVELVVRSHQQTMLDVEGHTPCDAPNDCPEGQTCNVKVQTCVDE